MSDRPTPYRPVEVCPAHPEDLDRVRRLNDESGLSPWPVEDYVTFRERSDAALTVVRRGEVVVGFALTLRVGAEMELLKLAVSREDRGRGVGRTLLETCVSEGRRRGCVACYLEVRAGNEAAVRFYRRLGFRTTGIRRNYYRDPVEDAILMSREL